MWLLHHNRRLIALTGVTVLNALRNAGADPNTRDNWGATGLYPAAAGGNTELVRYLLGTGANPSMQTVFDWAPLHWAAHNGKVDCVRLLIDAGANLSPLSDTTKTPLDMARKNNQWLIADMLIAAGAKTAQEVLESARTAQIYDSPMSPEQGGDETDWEDGSSEYDQEMVSEADETEDDCNDLSLR
ncbi:ankyrin repeat domain-containing protein [Aspergillus thermomutatus]|uniref:Uncharacterized protein n=1 Tax=Aspergillus thermomutatus TaxID=41047 RepID=A0A397G1X8_ASPTH|nr:uncharacterized protein CDV56_103334 [Aspergillus thermomutatus]RHZ45041.1 hypothetical protein CDV56_103334 [Aspergillus thermomutatus]